MQNEVREIIRSTRMLTKGDRCILAVSGGADSIGLLHVLMQLNGVLRVNYRVVHVHHGLRGAEADRDAAFVKKSCERYGVSCRIVEVNVKEFAEKHKLSTEEAARYLRYQALEEEAQRWEREEDTQKLVKIAVAHNKEDDAETIIMQLCRGSGLKGVSGMKPIRGRIIRPLLDVSRAEIERYLKKEDISWITDSTNLDDEYTRNRVRHDILPRLIEHVNKGAVDNITRAAKLVGQADVYIVGCAERVLKDHEIHMGSKVGIRVDVLKKQAPIIRTYIIRLLMGRVNRTMKNITAKHVEDIVNLMYLDVGKHIDLPYRLEALRTYDEILIYKKENQTDKSAEKPVEGTSTMTFKTFVYDPGKKIPESEYTKWFDYDKIEDLMDVRTRKSGDYLDLKGVGKKTLKSYMTDAKIPSQIRDTIPVLSVGDHVMWLVGYRISEHYKVTKDTKIIMEVTYHEGE